MDDFFHRFGGVGRLVSNHGLARLRLAHVCVVGVGGVGSWAAEALARSGIGRLTLVDLDEVCLTNINRQVHALSEAVGRSKVDAMAERVRQIDPDCRVTPLSEFFTEVTADGILANGYDYVVDAIDGVPNKSRLIAECAKRKLPLICSGGAGGKLDPTAVRVVDLAKVAHDRLLAEVRRRLRRHYGFPALGRPMGIDCVYSPEQPVFPQADRSVCSQRSSGQTGANLRLNCDAGFGTASFLTGTFGFVAASLVVRRLVRES